MASGKARCPAGLKTYCPAAHVAVLTPPGLSGGGYGAAAVGYSTTIDERATKADVYNSPGWKRMQDRAGTRGMAQPQEARGIVIDAQALSAYGIGERVFHQKFGYGEVISVEGDKLDIEFDHAGSKKIVARFVMPAHQVSDVPF